MTMRARPTVFLLGVNLLCVALLAYLWVGPDLSIDDLRWRPPPALAPDASSLSVITPTVPEVSGRRYAAILERPLFSLDRRPPPDDSAPQVDSPVPLGDVRIVGLLDGAAGYQGIIAIVSGAARRVSVGGSLGEWTLSAVAGTEAVFSDASGVSHRIAIERPRKAESVATPAGMGVAGSSESSGNTRAASALSLEERVRERFARRNALRQQHGLPPVSQ